MEKVIDIIAPTTKSNLYHRYRWTVVFGGVTWTAANRQEAYLSAIRLLRSLLARLNKEVGDFAS